MNQQSLLEVTPIADGLWRWTTPHPEWTPEKDRPGGWGRMVGSTYFEPPAGSTGALVLFDPLAPPAGTVEAGKFWTALDADVERAGRPVVIFVGNSYHVRGAQEFQRRYAGRHTVEIHAHEDAIQRMGIKPTYRFGPGASTRGGIEVLPIDGLDVGETAFFIRDHRALVFADAVLGAGGGRLAVAPPSWAAEGDAAGERYRELFRASIERMLQLDPAIVLPSHGEPVLAAGGVALRAALEGPAWGE